MLCFLAVAPAGPSPGWEEGGRQRGRWGPEAAPGLSRLHPGSVPNRPYKALGRWVEQQLVPAREGKPRVATEPSFPAGHRSAGERPNAPRSVGPPGWGMLAHRGGGRTCCPRLRPAAEVPADAKAQIRLLTPSFLGCVGPSRGRGGGGFGGGPGAGAPLAICPTQP